jgi:Fic family protein
MMRIPRRPPPWREIVSELGADALQPGVLGDPGSAVSDSKYLHWDDLRHRKPPRGLTLAQWWVSLQLARRSTAVSLPLLDTNGRPFWISRGDVVLRAIHELDREMAGSIESQTPDLINRDLRDRYVINSLMEEAVASSQIEGASTTRRVAKEMIRSGRRPRDTSERMILNNYQAMRDIREIRQESLTPEIVLSLHARLTHDTLETPDAVGRLRQGDEAVNVYDTRDNEVLHTAPPADQLPRRMQAMCDFANGKTPGRFVHPLIRSILLHFWLAYDHPFVDGNGRCARALFYWSMLHHGYWMCEFLSIAGVIRRRRAYSQYERAFLHVENGENDATYFVVYHLNLIRKALEELQEYLARKTREILDAERMLRPGEDLNYRQLALLSHALRHPGASYTVQSHQRSHGVAQQTARNDLYRLVAGKLLTKRKRGRQFVFRAADKLAEKLKGRRTANS